ncbi:MAG TPA: S24/S26 family peptidase [Candidatus Limnocylindrales bacterium]|nr:S24/S26 family peptidase [Candidatus Limnocylindrales bacterium]
MRLPRPFAVAVRGRSMEPVLRDGDWLLVLPVRARAGDVVVARDPLDTGRLLVKRASAVGGGLVRLRSESAHAADHEDRGPVAESAILGRAVLRYAPLGRIGRIR